MRRLRERAECLPVSSRHFLSPLDTGKYPHADQKYRFELCRDARDRDLLGLKRHGNTTSLILEFLDLN